MPELLETGRAAVQCTTFASCNRRLDARLKRSVCQKQVANGKQ